VADDSDRGIQRKKQYPHLGSAYCEVEETNRIESG